MKRNNDTVLTENGFQAICRAHALREKERLFSESEIAYKLSFMFLAHPESYAYALFFDRSMAYRSFVKLKVKGEPIGRSVLEEIAKAIDSDPAIKAFIVSHNHRNALKVPSPEDIKTTDILTEHYRESKVKFLGHYIISDFEYMILTESSLKCLNYKKN